MEKEDRRKDKVLGKVLRVVIDSVLGAFILIYDFIIQIYKYIIKNSKIFLATLAILGSITATLYLARTKPELLGIPGGRQELNSRKEVENLVAEVGKIIALPQGEVPTIATVTDLEKVKDQAFFANAQNGDKVLIYTNARKAILYRPSEKRIIEVGIVNVQKQPEKKDASPTPTPNPTPTPTPSESQ